MEAGATKQNTGRAQTCRSKPDKQVKPDPPDPPDRKRRRDARDEVASERISKRQKIEGNYQITQSRPCRRSTRLQERRGSNQRTAREITLPGSLQNTESRRNGRQEQRIGRKASRASRSKQRSVLGSNNNKQHSSSSSSVKAPRSGPPPSPFSVGDKAINLRAVERLRAIKKSPRSLSTPREGKGRNRKRLEDLQGVPAEPAPKQAQKSLKDSAAEPTQGDKGSHTPSGSKIDPIGYWTEEGTWPKEYFEQDDQTREYLNRDLDEESWLRKYWVPNMEHALARPKSYSSLGGKQSQSGTTAPSATTPSDQKAREEKSSAYTELRYEILLQTKGSFMSESKLGITNKSQEEYQALLDADQPVPTDSLFRDDLFKSTCQMIESRNEARVVRDISLLIVPSAEALAIRGAKQLEILVESVNEGWNSSIRLTKPRPQPDYSVGFRRDAFTDEQLTILEPFVGNIADTSTSLFMATWYMYFPFLTCEVKCGAAALAIADRQNAHSMTLAVRGIVEFFKLVKREKELHREILAFSISHDQTAVRIYGHYPVIDGNKTTFYRHTIHRFDFTGLAGKEKWTTYKFVKSVYDIWMPAHFKRICSVIDELPSGVNFDLSKKSEPLFPEPSGLLQQLEGHHLSQQSTAESASLPEKHDSQPSLGGSQDVTSNTTPSQGTQRETFQVPKKRRTAG